MNSNDAKKLTLDECCVIYMLYFSFESQVWQKGELALLRELCKRVEGGYLATSLYMAMRRHLNLSEVYIPGR